MALKSPGFGPPPQFNSGMMRPGPRLPFPPPPPFRRSFPPPPMGDFRPPPRPGHFMPLPPRGQMLLNRPRLRPPPPGATNGGMPPFQKKRPGQFKWSKPKKLKKSDQKDSVVKAESPGGSQADEAVSEPVNGEDVKIPDDFMQPLICKVCETHLNGKLQADAHYSGKNHAKKAQQYIEKLRKEKGISAPIPSPKTEKKDTKKEEPGELFCKLCDVAFTSAIQSQQHYNGRNHQRRLRGEPPMPKGFYNAATGKWQRNPPGVISSQKNQSFPCPLCGVSFSTGTEQFAHMLTGHKIESQKFVAGNAVETLSVATVNGLNAFMPGTPLVTTNAALAGTNYLVPVANGFPLVQI